MNNTRSASRASAALGKRLASQSVAVPAQTSTDSLAVLDTATSPASPMVTSTTRSKKARHGAAPTLRVSQPVECERCGYILHVLPNEDTAERLASHWRSLRCQKAARTRMRRLARAGVEAAGSPLPSPLEREASRSTADGEAQPLSPVDESQLVSCYQCHAVIELDEARYHVGQHILRAILGVKEKLKTKINPATACGFCGRSGTCKFILPEETLQAPPDAQDVALVFSCERARMTSHDQAKAYSPESPSTNVPVACAICLDAHDAVVDGVVHWKFGIFHHIRTMHPEHWDPIAQRVKNIPESFVPFLSVSPRELRDVAPDAPLPYPGPVLGL